MANKVPPYHSINPRDPDVHHVYWDCPTGKQIPPANKRSGTNNWRKCKNCTDIRG